MDASKIEMALIWFLFIGVLHIKLGIDSPSTSITCGSHVRQSFAAAFFSDMDSKELGTKMRMQLPMSLRHVLALYPVEFYVGG